MWFEAVHDMMTSDLQKISAPVVRLTEAFYDYFLVRSMLGNQMVEGRGMEGRAGWRAGLWKDGLGGGRGAGRGMGGWAGVW